MAEIERGNPIIGDGNTYRFYKSNLPAVVWNGKKNCALAEFQNGVFETDNKKIAQQILDLGYPQVSPTAKEPPNIIVGLPGQSIDTSATSTENIRPGKGENRNEKPITPVRLVNP